MHKKIEFLHAKIILIIVSQQKLKVIIFLLKFATFES